MTGDRKTLLRFKNLFLSAWPLWVLLVFSGLTVIRLLPGGAARAAVAGPLLLMMPGALVLGAVFGERRRPQGPMFFCYAALLGVLCSAFASLLLYATGTLIMAGSVYLCLLAVSSALAVVAQTRLLLGRPGKGRRAARGREALTSNQSDAETDDAETPADTTGRSYLSVVALVAGISFLAGGQYFYNHLSHPAQAGYTWMAWTGIPITHDIAVGPAGAKLNFQIVHRESNPATFRLAAAWLGTPSRPLSKALNFSIGPDRTFRGSLFVPPLPDGCTYRIVITLMAAQQIDSLTRSPQTWSINADVYNPRKSSKKCVQ